MIFLFALLLSLPGCQEDEQACYDKIDADLMSSAEFGRKSGDFKYANAAIDSAYEALAILSDDDRSICDYVTAGPLLERK